tara:strand:- start:42 stop:632 length:591 start_codon:yes stop_codon:yes gene_type:complete
MSYNLKDVFYLGATHTYLNSVYGSGGIEGNIPIDISAYVDPIAKGRTRGQGLAVYRVHSQVAGDVTGNMVAMTDTGSFAHGLTVKPYATSGDNSGALETGDLTPESDLLIFGKFYVAPATATPGVGTGLNGQTYLEPSDEVPYVCVRDTIFQILETTVGIGSGGVGNDFDISYRLECAMITLDTATLNQLLRTQTA